MNAFFLALLASFFLALQGALMAAHYRSMDELSAVAYRGLSLGITFLPLLFFVPRSAFALLPGQLPYLLLAAAIAGIANTFAAFSMRILVISLGNAIGFSTAAFVGAVIDAAVYGKFLSREEVVVIVLLLVALYFFSRGSGSVQLVREGRLITGVLCGVLFGVLIGIAFAIVGELSKASHPFLVGYCWELLIGVCSIVFALGRGVTHRRGLESISLRRFWGIAWAAAPTALGTGLYMYALSTGPLALVSALLSTTMVFSMIFGLLFYKEKFGMREVVLLLIITVLLALLKICAS
ncbi:MAG: DMT family transporter [Bdellovibrionales bacterium]|nr:DMT family transporter [Bdellovibrionales bacterium]